jgi:tetratricopeptide (TPR) repeat protein
MRLAILVAPRGLGARNADGRAELERALARVGFVVVAVWDEAQLIAQLRAGPTPDTLLVVASGPLVDDGDGAAIALAEGNAPPMRVAQMVDAVAMRGARSVLVVVEVTHHTGDDALAAAERVDELRTAVDARAHGASALVAVRAEGRTVSPLAFTERLMRLAEEARAEGDHLGVTLEEVVERMRKSPDPDERCASSFALVKGPDDFELAPGPDGPRDRSDEPCLGPLLALADGARERAEWDHALAGYQAALLVTRHDRAARAAVYARIGGLEQARGRMGEALRALEKAHQAAPEDGARLDALVDVAAASGDWARVIELCEARASRLVSVTDIVNERVAIARVKVERMGDLSGAVDALESARTLDPSRGDVLEALRRAYQKLERWNDVIAVNGALAAHAAVGTERASRRFSQARVALKHLRDETSAIAYLEETLDDDATHAEALERLIALRTARGEEDDLRATLTTLAERLLALGDAERAGDLRVRIGMLGGAPLPDLRARATAPGADAGVAEPESTGVRGAASYARQYARHARAGQWDEAYLAALALEELGAVDAEHQATLDHHRPEGLAIKAPLDDAAWALLRAPGADEVLETLFRSIARAAISASVDERRARRTLVTLDPARRLPETSTASIARTFQWAARALTVPCPELFVIDDVPGDIKAVLDIEPRTALGPGITSGRSTKELAFEAARHLTYYRPEHAVLLAFPTLQELTLLVLAAVQIALPAMPIPPAAAAAVETLRARLVRHLDAAEYAAVIAAVHRIEARDGRVGLPAWSRSVELTAARAGLLLCGDLRTAMGCLRRSPGVAGVSPEDQRADLVAFCASPPFAALRAELAVMAPAAPSSSAARLSSPGRRRDLDASA